MTNKETPHKNRDFHNKKAMSNVIATMIVLAISVVAITLVYFVIQNIFNETLLSPQANCAELKLETPIQIQSVCFNSETQNIELSLRRNFAQTKIESLKFSSNENEWICSKKVYAEHACSCEILDEGEIKKYFLSANQQTEKIIIGINNCVILETEKINEC